MQHKHHNMHASDNVQTTASLQVHNIKLSPPVFINVNSILPSETHLSPTSLTILFTVFTNTTIHNTFFSMLCCRRYNYCYCRIPEINDQQKLYRRKYNATCRKLVLQINRLKKKTKNQQFTYVNDHAHSLT